MDITEPPVSVVTEENTLDDFDGILPSKQVLTLSWLLVGASVILSITSCVLCCCTSCGRNRGQTQNRGCTGKHVYLTASTIVLLLVALTAGGYSAARHALEVQDYRGPMRVVGWTVNDEIKTHERHEQVRVGGETGHIEYFEYTLGAELQVEWGYEWGCAHRPDKLCTTDAGRGVSACEQVICRTYDEDETCSQDELDQAHIAVEECANDIFNPDLVGTGYYTPYDPHQGPSQDAHWPSVVAYGNCDNCRAKNTAPRTGALRAMQIVVIVLLILSLTMVGSAFVWYCRPDQSMNNNHQPNSHAVEMPVVPAAAKPQSHVVQAYNNNMVLPPAGLVLLDGGLACAVPTTSPAVVYGTGGDPYHDSNVRAEPDIPVVYAGTDPPVVTASPVYESPFSKYK